MSLYDFVYNLQKKPLNYRRRVLVFLLVVSFACLAVLWIISFKKQVYNSGAYGEIGSESSGLETKGMLSPAAALIGGFKNMASDVTAKIKDYSKTMDGIKDTRVRPVYELPRNY